MLGTQAPGVPGSISDQVDLGPRNYEPPQSPGPGQGRRVQKGHLPLPKPYPALRGWERLKHTK